LQPYCSLQAATGAISDPLRGVRLPRLLSLTLGLFRQGHARYLVFAYARRGQSTLYSGLCSPTIVLERAGDVLAILGPATVVESSDPAWWGRRRVLLGTGAAILALSALALAR